MTRPPSAARELRCHWPAVLACGVTAIFAWGFGFYGQSVYLAELRRLHDWPSALIAGATTTFYLTGALLLTRVHAALDRLGPRVVLGGGAVLMGAGATLFSGAQSPWQLYLAAVVMAGGWACTSSTAITTTLAFWFHRQRGLAISLALSGASAGGFTVAPALVTLSRHVGLSQAVPMVAGALLVLLLPLVLLGLGRTAVAAPAVEPGRSRTGAVAYTAGRQALRDPHFWTVAAPFALGLTAQVGFLVHLVAFVLPRLGTGGAAAAVSIVALAATFGRLALGLVIDRLDQRRAAAASFASQAVALGLMLAWPGQPAALYGGCLIFGLSVGNVITLPSLIVQREFAARAFGLVIGLSTAVGQFTYAFGPTLVGLVHDTAGGYPPALGLCLALDLAAAWLVWPHRPGS